MSDSQEEVWIFTVLGVRFGNSLVVFHQANVWQGEEVEHETNNHDCDVYHLSVIAYDAKPHSAGDWDDELMEQSDQSWHDSFLFSHVFASKGEYVEDAEGKETEPLNHFKQQIVVSFG